MADTNSGAQAQPQAKKPDIDLAALDITVDRSRGFSEIHGEHTLGFIQDRLPFDKGGRLDVASLDAPDYAEAKAALIRRVVRLKKEEEEAIKSPVTDTSNKQPTAEVIENDPDAHINLVDWAKGKVKVQPHRVYLIAQRRLGKRFNLLAEVAEEMVKRKMLLGAEVKV